MHALYVKYKRLENTLNTICKLYNLEND